VIERHYASVITDVMDDLAARALVTLAADQSPIKGVSFHD